VTFDPHLYWLAFLALLVIVLAATMR